MSSPRLVRFSVSGMRTLEDVRLDLDGLSVLIGENGSGKSSLIEALEILRLAAEGRFLDSFNDVHGGFPAVTRVGTPKLAFGARVESPEWRKSGSDRPKNRGGHSCNGPATEARTSTQGRVLTSSSNRARPTPCSRCSSSLCYSRLSRLSRGHWQASLYTCRSPLAPAGWTAS